MIKIQITSTETTTFTGIGKASGKEFSMTKQVGWAYLPNEPYPTKMEINIEKNQPPYSVGYYKLSPSSLGLNRFNQLCIDKLVLIASPEASSTSSSK